MVGLVQGRRAGNAKVSPGSGWVGGRSPGTCVFSHNRQGVGSVEPFVVFRANHILMIVNVTLMPSLNSRAQLQGPDLVSRGTCKRAVPETLIVMLTSVD